MGTSVYNGDDIKSPEISPQSNVKKIGSPNKEKVMIHVELDTEKRIQFTPQKSSKEVSMVNSEQNFALKNPRQ